MWGLNGGRLFLQANLEAGGIISSLFVGCPAAGNEYEPEKDANGVTKKDRV